MAGCLEATRSLTSSHASVSITPGLPMLVSTYHTFTYYDVHVLEVDTVAGIHVLFEFCTVAT